MEEELLDNNLQSVENVNEDTWAGFWIRVGATLIDFIALLPITGISMYNLYILKSLPLALLLTLISLLYKPFMEYKYSATFGKMAVKIKVVNENFQQITISQSVLRYIPWLVSNVGSIYATILLFQHPDFLNITTMMGVGTLQNELVTPYQTMIGSSFLLICVIVVAFSSKKQGIHDMMAKTYCVRSENL